jgi:hopene-associated glycosyltransferase HpnB
MTLVIAIVALAAWLYLLSARGAFWSTGQSDTVASAPPARWPHVVAVVPARNEAGGIANCIRSLLTQDYPGTFSIILMDDDSSDGTAQIAAGTASALGMQDRLTILQSARLPTGWTGKMWAVNQGTEAALHRLDAPDYLLLTDADIVHHSRSVSWLAAKAENDGLVLTSLMVKLRCESLAERIHVPAFVFFFQMLYPFSWVNQQASRTAAAAGGCMLVRAEALRAAGGIESIREALIDDCALVAKLKAQGPIWLGLTDRVRSIRPYPEFADFRAMVSRSAYAQLHYSPLWLIGTLVGMSLIYLAPPLLAVFAHGFASFTGFAAWLLMAVAFFPILRLYRLSPAWGFALPGIAFLYTLYTVDSAVQYMLGRGGTWKGRTQANVAARR